MKYLFLILTVFVTIMSCKEDKKGDIARLMEEWEDNEVRFPDNLIFTRFVTDTVDFQIPKDTGFFDETVPVKCNTTSPVKVKIKGNVQLLSEREPAKLSQTVSADSRETPERSVY